MNVADRFQRAQRELRSQRLRRSWIDLDFSFLIGMTISVCLMLLEAAYWIPGVSLYKVPARVAMAALFVLPLNGWLILHLQAGGAPRTGPAWRRVLRCVLASIPLTGWLLLGESIRKTMPAGAATRGPDLTALAGELGGGRWLDWFFRSGAGQLWLVIGQMLPVFLWAFWLAGEEPRSRPVAILSVLGILHLAAAGFMGRHFVRERLKIQASGWRAAAFRGLAAFWLLPLAGPFVGLLLLLFPVDESRETNTLTWSAYASRTSARRLPLWMNLQESLPSRRRTSPRTGEAGLRRMALCRLKTLLLAMETTALAEVLARQPALQRGLWIAGGAAAALAAVGLLALGVLSVARLLRKADASWLPVARYLLLTQTAFAAGIVLGSLLGAGWTREACLVLALVSVLCGIAALFFHLPLKDLRNGLIWPLLFVSLGYFGVILVDPVHGSFRLHLFRLALKASPAASLALGLSFGGWLLHPFSVRDLGDRRLADWLRARLAFLAVSAVAPLGGLFVPFWLWLHRDRPLRDSG